VPVLVVGIHPFIFLIVFMVGDGAGGATSQVPYPAFIACRRWISPAVLIICHRCCLPRGAKISGALWNETARGA